MCYFLHQSESKEIDEMKRIAVVVMRKDRELVVEEDHHIPLSWQTTIKTKWALRSDYVFYETQILHHGTTYAYFRAIQNF